MSRSKFIDILIVVFDIQSVVMTRWVSSGQSVDRHYYIEGLYKLSERVRRKEQGFWRNKWILHQDKMPFPNTLSVRQFLASGNIRLVIRLFLLSANSYFSKDQIRAQRNPFSVGRTEPTELLYSLTVNDLPHCF
jgi:hypothetical protein